MGTPDFQRILTRCATEAVVIRPENADGFFIWNGVPPCSRKGQLPILLCKLTDIKTITEITKGKFPLK